MTELIGFTAAILTTIAFLPQVIKTYRSRSAKELSLSTFSMFTLGVLLWLVYGVLDMNMPVILANLFTLLLALTLLVMKFRYKA